MSKMSYVKKVSKGLAAVIGVVGVYVAYDFNKHRVIKNQAIAAALRHYVTVRGLSLVGSVMKRKLEAATLDVRKAQEDFLMQQMKDNLGTEYSQEFRHAEVKSIEDFLKRQPLTRYSDYARPVARMMSGETNILTPTEPSVFAVTSGTSGNRSIIPMLSKQTKIFFLDGISVLYKCMIDTFPNTKMLNKDLKIFFAPNWQFTITGTKVGPNSASPERSKDTLHLYSTPPPAYKVRSEPEALYLYLLFALLDPQIGMIEANFSSLIFNAFVAMETQIDQLTKDIETGTINPDLDIDPEVRKELEQTMKADPTRAKEIRQAMEAGREGLALRIWPEMHMLLGADTGTFEMYGEKLRTGYCKGVPLYSPIYAASEGLLGVNIWPDQLPSRYLLHPRTQFFEFIAENDMDLEKPPTKLLHELDKDQNYEMVITNPSCLYRYRFGDVVRVVDFHNQCPVVEFKYRKGQFLNVRGEKTSEAMFYEVLKNSIHNVWDNIKLNDYCCMESIILDNMDVPKDFKTSAPCYHVFLELEGVDHQKVKEISMTQRKMLDDSLMVHSYPYSSFRSKGSIAPLQVHLVTPGSFQELRTFMLADSPATSNQYKVPRVLKRADAAEFMLKRVVR